MSLRLTLLEMFSYLDSKPTSRNVCEGERLLNAGHLLLCGLKEISDSEVKIVALCLQTSALTSPPHQLDGEFSVKNGEVKAKKFICSCKAGLGGRCKHVSSVLLQCTRVDINRLPKISSTDVKCIWSKKKEASIEQYKPEPLADFKCLKYKPIPHVDEEIKERFRNILMPYAPNSCISIHRQRSKARQEQPSTSTSIFPVSNSNTPQYILDLFQNAGNSVYMKLLDNICTRPLRECCQKFYASKIQCTSGVSLCQETINNPKKWQMERKFRITGSRCYGLYIYNGCDWNLKSCKYFWPKSFSSMYVKHGLAYENEARNIYSSRLGYTVVQLGLVVLPKYPFLGYSPDGLVLKNGVPWKLLEIKCPFKGREMTAAALIQNSDFKKIENGFLILKKKHPYYGQIQLGMILLNVAECDFIVYAPFDKTFLNVIVHLDINFVEELLKKLKCVYFEEMLHSICLNKNNY